MQTLYSHLLRLSIEAIPDVTPFLRPSTAGDIATYTFFGFSGIVIGGDVGLLTGSGSAGRTINRDADSRKRIEIAFQKFKADVLRKEADDVDGGKGASNLLGL